ncbi:hypothetical protein EAI_02315 [Harpegnathos saltator]|uniref:Uncharacterized protein n=1 Tax=Harpegnathos saltator TaxID=610380 RepID=E2BZK4_HARSA|nr:hypothetical protein EAI_02315 [Harpegnathos saltator]
MNQEETISEPHLQADSARPEPDPPVQHRRPSKLRPSNRSYRVAANSSRSTRVADRASPSTRTLRASEYANKRAPGWNDNDSAAIEEGRRVPDVDPASTDQLEIMG